MLALTRAERERGLLISGAVALYGLSLAVLGRRSDRYSRRNRYSRRLVLRIRDHREILRPRTTRQPPRKLLRRPNKAELFCR